MHNALPADIPTPQLLLAAYCQGVFPMGRGRDDPAVDWYSADHRAILPLEGFRCSRSLRQIVRRGDFEIRIDTAFEQVMRACAQPRRSQQETWINQTLVAAYVNLHRRGFAHSLEAWRKGQLAGGLYGVSIGAAFFGESMFHRPEAGGTNASKVCLVHLVKGMKAGGYRLLDVQMTSPHMARFGVIEIPREKYLEILEPACGEPDRWLPAFGGPGRIA